jgi:hypothetical protein
MSVLFPGREPQALRLRYRRLESWQLQAVRRDERGEVIIPTRLRGEEEEGEEVEEEVGGEVEDEGFE